MRASDGLNLKAAYFSHWPPGPGVLLLYQCGVDKQAWDGLAKDLADAGFHVLTADYRGYGENGERFSGVAERTAIMHETWSSDLEADLRICSPFMAGRARCN